MLRGPNWPLHQVVPLLNAKIRIFNTRGEYNNYRKRTHVLLVVNKTNQGSWQKASPLRLLASILIRLFNLYVHCAWMASLFFAVFRVHFHLSLTFCNTNFLTFIINYNFLGFKQIAMVMGWFVWLLQKKK